MIWLLSGPAFEMVISGRLLVVRVSLKALILCCSPLLEGVRFPSLHRARQPHAQLTETSRVHIREVCEYS